MKRSAPMVPKEGTRIELIDMPEDPDPVPRGSTSTVLNGPRFGDWTQIIVCWDNGRTLNLCVPPDAYKVVS